MSNSAESQQNTNNSTNRSVCRRGISSSVQASASQGTAPVFISIDDQKISAPSKQTGINQRSRKSCKDFKAGHCRRGEECRLDHSLPILQLNEPQPKGHDEQAKLARQKIQCGEMAQNQETSTRQLKQQSVEEKHGKEGNEVPKATKKKRQKESTPHQRRQAVLKAEEDRRRRKERESQEAAKRHHQEALAARRELEAAAVENFVASGSSLIECGAGLEIRHVITGFDLCRITIKNLPCDANREEIADIFRQQGLDSSQFFVSQVTSIGTKLEAVVLANADQGQALAIGLDGIEFRDTVLSFEVGENANWSTMGSSPQDTPFLAISWWIPSETLVATYATIAEAQTQARRLTSKIWKGHRVRILMTTSGSALKHCQPESVKVLGFSAGTALNDEIYEFLGSRNVKILKSAPYDPEGALRAARQLMTSLRGAQPESYEVLTDGTHVDGEVKIKVEFSDWDEANAAHDTLDKRQLGPYRAPVIRSRLPKLQALQYTINIPRQQYEAQKRQWDLLSEKREEVDAHVHTRIGSRGAVFIRVLGKDKKAVGSLKVRVESMVAGEKLDPTTHWHPSFATPAGSKTFFERVYAETKVYVRNDFKTRSLKIYGEPNVIRVAREMIRKEVHRLAQLETTRELDHPTLRFFIREGLGKLKDLLGEENVVLNVSTTPAKITIKGGGEAIHHLRRLIDDSESLAANFTGGLLPEGDNEICPVCTDNVSHPEQLGCGHTYCSACLKHFLTSATDFPLVCMGNKNTCKVPVALPFLHRFLPKEVFEHHIEAAFVSYLEQHPLELKYCTTPDCTQIYRRSSEKTELHCPSCFSTICPECDEEAHEGMTCEERRIYSNPAEQERLNDALAAANGWKKCPQCTTLIEKTDGCNHVECRCGAHICWVCVGIFDARSVYLHMNEVHGGIHDIPEVHLLVPAGGRAAAVLHAADRHFLQQQENERARQEIQRQREEAGRRQREEAERRQREAAERRQREEVERRQRWEVERRQREEAGRRQREEAERRQRKEVERKQREEAERRQREEVERRQRKEADRREREEADRRRREEEEKREREDQRRQQEEAERRRREAKERLQEEEMARAAERVRRMETQVKKTIRNSFWS